MRDDVKPRGDLMLEDPEASEDMDCEVERDGCFSATGFAAFSLLENRPMVSSKALPPTQWPVGGRNRRRVAVCNGTAADKPSYL